jgi:hypothetical protein
MTIWYQKVIADINKIPDCIDYFEKEYLDAKHELSLKVKSIERHGSELPGIVEHRYSQLQELESILEFLNIELKKLRSSTFKRFLENYQRSLTSRDCEKYVDGDNDVVIMTLLVNEVALMRNKFLSISKGLENKGWMISHIVKLRSAGLEDIVIK